MGVVVCYASRAATSSSKVSILGRSKETHWRRNTGASLSRTIFAAIISPLIAAATTALTTHRRAKWRAEEV
jgi:hypothetical protein